VRNRKGAAGVMLVMVDTTPTLGPPRQAVSMAWSEMQPCVCPRVAPYSEGCVLERGGVRRVYACVRQHGGSFLHVFTCLLCVFGRKGQSTIVQGQVG